MIQVEITIRNHVVKVLANKNHGIYDIILGTKNKKFVPIRRMSEILTTFQGRQYDSEETMEHLKNVLNEILNVA